MHGFPYIYKCIISFLHENVKHLRKYFSDSCRSALRNQKNPPETDISFALTIAFFAKKWYTVSNPDKGGVYMPEDMLRHELTMLAKRVLFLNIAAYLIHVIVKGATLSFALGLLLGTAVLFGTLLLLQISVKRMAADAKRTGTTNQRRYLLFYALRLLLFAAAFAAALIYRTWISPLAVALPMLYPRLIYTAGAVFPKSGFAVNGKKR